MVYICLGYLDGLWINVIFHTSRLCCLNKNRPLPTKSFLPSQDPQLIPRDLAIRIAIHRLAPTVWIVWVRGPMGPTFTQSCVVRCKNVCRNNMFVIFNFWLQPFWKKICLLKNESNIPSDCVPSFFKVTLWLVDSPNEGHSEVLKMSMVATGLEEPNRLIDSDC